MDSLQSVAAATMELTPRTARLARLARVVSKVSPASKASPASLVRQGIPDRLAWTA